MELNSDGSATNRTAELKIHWIEEDIFLASDSIALPDYVLKGTPSLNIRVHQFDQYGNPYRSHSRQQTQITVTGVDSADSPITDINPGETGNQPSINAVRQVISRGYASWSPSVNVDAEDKINVAYDIRQLARNSKGAAVRVGTGGVADFATWVTLGTSSAESRMKVVDALLTTYNDARVLVQGADTSDTAGNRLYPDLINDDGVDDSPVATDYANPKGSTADSIVGTPDPFVYGAPRNAPSGLDPEWSDALNLDALDTYQDYEGVVKSGQGLVGDDNTASPAINNPDPVTSDGSGSVLVVETADSANTGRYNVDLVGKTAEATEFLADTQDATDTDTKPELVFSFDEDDIYVDNTNAEGRDHHRKVP